MPLEETNQSDIDSILSHRHDNGADLWATPDKRLLKGSPFSTFDCVHYLLELGMPSDDPILKSAADLIFSTWKSDGRFKIYPSGGIYPCQTAIALKSLCYLGYETDDRLQKTFQHFRNTQYHDGGWRCNKFSFGHGEETEFSNPLPTLNVLDAFRYQTHMSDTGFLDKAIEFLLQHWVIRRPIGPCHYGIGTLFMQLEYPFRGYNLFQYVYVLSFYQYAIKDERFKDAFEMLQSKTVDGQIVIERVVPKLARLSFCRKGMASPLATKRYQEILQNIH